MLKTYIVPFAVPFNVSQPGQVAYKIRVTDRQEARDNWKRAEAINRACDTFSEAYSGYNGHKFVLIEGVREV